MEKHSILDEIIKSELCKFSEDTNRQTNKNVIIADEAIAAVIKQINETNEELADELENATDLGMNAYSDMYFREGFRVAFKLQQEIKDMPLEPTQITTNKKIVSMR